MKFSNKKTALLTLSILLSLSAPTYAADANTNTDEAVRTPDVVVTATRTEAEVKAVPNTVEVITNEQIQKLGATDVYSALRLADNINIQQQPTGFGKRISMRGMASNQALILVNGQRTAIEDTSTSQNLLALDRINVQNIDRIEIIRGAASAQYGSDALAGVINIITKKAADKPSVTVGVNTGTISTNNYYNINFGKEGKFSSSLNMNFGRERKRDTQAGSPSSSYVKTYLYGPTQNFNFNGRYEIDENSSLNLDLGYYNADLIGYWGKYTQQFGNAILNTSRRDLSLSYDGKTDNSNYMIRTFYSKLNKSRFLPYTGMLREGIENNQYSVWGIEGKDSVQLNDEHLLTYGAEYNKYNVEGANFGKDAQGSKDIDTYAAYVQDEWMVGDKLLLIPAVRYDHHSDYGSKTTPKFGATYFLNDNSRFKVNWGKGFKAPSVSELYMELTHMSSLTYGNPDLVPEESTSWDVSYEAEANNNFGKITYFNNKIDNMITTRGIAGTNDNEYYNVEGTSKLHGIELTLGRNFDDNWTLKATSNWTSSSNENRVASEGHGVDNIADNITTLQLSYDDNKAYGYNFTLWNQWVSGYNYSKQVGTRPNIKTIYPSATYSTTNFVINKKFGEGNRVYAGLDNIFDKKIADINLDGRIWRVGAEWTF